MLMRLSRLRWLANDSVTLDVLCKRRYDHVGCSLHVKKCGIELHARPWHWGWRPVLGDHFLNKSATFSPPPILTEAHGSVTCYGQPLCKPYSDVPEFQGSA